MRSTPRSEHNTSAFADRMRQAGLDLARLRDPAGQREARTANLAARLERLRWPHASHVAALRARLGRSEPPPWPDPEDYADALAIAEAEGER
ncbi:MAG: hypothetical protein EPN50_10575 [Chloroflexota bacterium]|nr:MAG: hypothetical protein EPN50_10575 [Chloroflexota bacterium]